LHLTVVILTLNEEKHLARCLASLNGIENSVLVVDSFSSDNTHKIAKDYGASVICHDFINQAQQFNWALKQLDNSTEWILRIDADEYLTPELSQEIKSILLNIKPNINGIYINRRMSFQGRLIKHGGVFPVQVMRLFKYGYGECENRWMDEHILVNGDTQVLKAEVIDDNLNNLSWWISKHNNYATREAVDLLNLEYNFNDSNSIASINIGKKTSFKRWFKEVVYARMPRGLRALIYFLYRYILRLGFLDGKEGLNFHLLQGFWYRYLIDAKVNEIKKYMKKNNSTVEVAISDVFGQGFTK
jgi:glycosyltransferase involved in cell wall biosynthesis